MFFKKRKQKALQQRALEISSQMTAEPTQQNFTLQQELTSVFQLMTGNNEKITDPFKQSLWVAACINTIVKRFASAPFEIKKGDDLVESGPVFDLFENPNPFQDSNIFHETISGLLSLTGNCMIVMDGLADNKTNSLPTAMFPLHSKHFEAVLNKERNTPVSWKMEVDGQKVTIPWENVIHIKKWNPNSLILGHDPLEPAENTIAMDWFSGLFNRKFFKNDATPNGIIEHPSGKASRSKAEEIREVWEGNHKGVNQAHKIGVLFGGMKYTQMGITQRDMQFMEGKKLSREEIAAILGVPPATVGIFEFANYANAEAQIKMLWEGTIIPTQAKSESSFRAKFFKRFAPDLSGRYNTKNIKALQEDEDKKVARAVQLFGIGVPLEEINDKLGLELSIDDLAWKRTWLVPFSMIPADQLIENPPRDDDNQENSTKLSTDVEKYKTIQLSRAKWVRIRRKSQKNIKSFEKEMIKFFDKQEKLLLNELKNAIGGDLETLSIGDVIKFDWLEQDKLLIKATKPHHLDGLELGGQAAIDEIGLIDVAFDTDDKIVTDFLLDKQSLITGINDTVKDQVSLTLAEAIEAGESLQQQVDRVAGTFDQARNRAQTIARTEVNDAVNGGREAGFSQSGVEGKNWLNSGGENVRESHSNGAGVGGEVVKVGETFSNGLRWPSDTASGDAGETANCVCTMTAVIKIN